MFRNVLTFNTITFVWFKLIYYFSLRLFKKDTILMRQLTSLAKYMFRNINGIINNTPSGIPSGNTFIKSYLINTYLIDQARLREVEPVVSRDSRTMDNYVVSLMSVFGTFRYLCRNTGRVLFFHRKLTLYHVYNSFEHYVKINWY